MMTLIHSERYRQLAHRQGRKVRAILSTLLFSGAILASPLSSPAQVCGNGVVESGETCDDGNSINGDCCGSTCHFEPGCQVAQIRIDPKATYLRISNDDRFALDSQPIDLQLLGITPGTLVRLQVVGHYSVYSPPDDEEVYRDTTGVFSSTDTLLSRNLSAENRVAGAVGTGLPAVATLPTFDGNLPTDIPEDFGILDTTVVVPPEATYLFISPLDSYFGDNADKDADYAVGISLGPCAEAVQPKLTLGKLTTPPGDDKLTFTGQVTLPFPFTPAVDPLSSGVQLQISDNAGNVLDVTIPGGSYVNPPGAGWKVNRTGTKWTYQDKTKTPIGGVYKLVIEDKSKRTPGLLKFTAKGKRGSYAVAAGDLPVTVRLIVVPSTLQCADAHFSNCAFNTRGSTLKCK